MNVYFRAARRTLLFLIPCVYMGLYVSPACCFNDLIVPNPSMCCSTLYEICPVDLNDAAYVLKFAVNMWKC